jgi:DNA-binding transcriptional MerR regulator
MPIGRLARLCRLTVKALRHYDAQGLLAPTWTDPRSGYRYYRAEQVSTATSIALLRSLDVPIAVIRSALAAESEQALAAVLGAERDCAARDLAAREQTLRSIERLIRGTDAMRYHVTLHEQRPSRLVGVRGTARAEHLDPDTGTLCAQAEALLATTGLTSDEGLTALFPLDLEDTISVTVGAIISSTVTLRPGTVEEMLPGGTWASTLHVGPYVELPLAYAALLEHLHERGHTALAPITETYLVDPTSASPHELLTRVAVPLDLPD